MRAAPYFADLAEGPEDAAAYWATTDDDVDIRIGIWPGGGSRGTVFLFPGRSEYVEKYGRTAKALAARGFASLAIDWRGQGLATRLADDPNVGHVLRFRDYQRDVVKVLSVAEQRALPRPWFMLAHSMGGCIGLRTLADPHPFKAAAFSAPMWGIAIAPAMRALAHTVPRVASRLGFGTRYAPTTGRESYLLNVPFDDNMLTTDRGMWDYMVHQVREQPRFRLGGPSLTWLAEALKETTALLAAQRPDLPVHVSVGSREKIVDPAAIDRMMEGWDSASFVHVDGAEHELLMEREAIRTPFLDRIDALFANR